VISPVDWQRIVVATGIYTFDEVPLFFSRRPPARATWTGSRPVPWLSLRTGTTELDAMLVRTPARILAGRAAGSLTG